MKNKRLRLKTLWDFVKVAASIIVILLGWDFVIRSALRREGRDSGVFGPEGWNPPPYNQSQLLLSRTLHHKYHTAEYNYHYSGVEACPLPCEEKVCHFSIRGFPVNSSSRYGFIVINGQLVHNWTSASPGSVHLVRLRRSCRPKEVIFFTDTKKAQVYSSSGMGKGDVIVGATTGNISDFLQVVTRFCIGSDLKHVLLRELSPLDTWAFVFTPGRRGMTRCMVWPKSTEASVWQSSYTFGREFPVLNKKGTVSMETLLHMLPTVEAGGRWRPPDCRPRFKIALVIPYRDREDHLSRFLSNIHRFLQKQYLDYVIVIVEQADSHPFNRAALLNVGYLEMVAREHFDCFAFHDVDLVPEDMCNLYYCSTQPRLLTVARNSYRYRVAYWHYFGGAIMMSPDQVERISGFPTIFYGWGGEDDEIWMRLRVHNMQPSRYAAEVSGYYQLEHKEQNERIDIWGEIFDHARYTDDGLPTLRYKLVSHRKTPLYTHICVELPPPD